MTDIALNLLLFILNIALLIYCYYLRSKINDYYNAISGLYYIISKQEEELSRLRELEKS